MPGSKRERRIANLILRTQLSGIPFDISPFIEKAVRSGIDDIAGYAYALIVNSKRFRARFPGIFEPKGGGLKMSVAEYMSRESSFVDLASQHGFALQRRNIGQLMRNGVDPQEFAVRARGIQLAQTNPGLVDFLNSQASRVNQARARAADGGSYNRIRMIRNPREVVNFFAGRGDRELYALYEGALFRHYAEQAGVKLGAAAGAKLAGKTAGILNPEDIEQGYSNIAHRLRVAGVDIASFGLSNRDLETIEFGGAGRAEVTQRAEQALAQAQERLSSDMGGTGVSFDGGRPVIEEPM